MPEKIAFFCIATVVLGTIYSSFGLQWPNLVKKVYVVLCSVLVIIYIWEW